MDCSGAKRSSGHALGLPDEPFTRIAFLLFPMLAIKLYEMTRFVNRLVEIPPGGGWAVASPVRTEEHP